MENSSPKIVFFSGGTALNGLARSLTETNSCCSYIITTFDSGGCSGKLRRAFNMPAVGDVRNRIIALADTGHYEKKRIAELLAARLPFVDDRVALRGEISHLASGVHPLMKGISDMVRNILAERFSMFLDLIDDDYNLDCSSLGNIVLATGFMRHQRVLAPPIIQLSRLVGARGTVRAATVDNGHLAVRLASGEILAGQHLFTGKEVEPIGSPIESMWICSNIDDPWPRGVHASSLALKLISQADMIVYSMGSFYSSLLAALSPRGIGYAVSQNPVPKIFIPNMGHDPELLGHDLSLQIERLLEILKKDNSAQILTSDVLGAVLIDSENGNYPEGFDLASLESMPVKVIDRRLVSEESDGLIDPELLSSELMRLAETGIF